jgi:hypothetical protein
MNVDQDCTNPSPRTNVALLYDLSRFDGKDQAGGTERSKRLTAEVPKKIREGRGETRKSL